MAYISGNTTDNIRIVIVDENNWSVEHTSEKLSGDYEINNLSASGTKTIIARDTSGESIGYGAVTPLFSVPTPFTDNFNSGSNPDSAYWTEVNSGGTAVLTGGKLRLSAYSSNQVTRWASVTFDNYEVIGDFQIDTDVEVVHSEPRWEGNGWTSYEQYFKIEIDDTHWLRFRDFWTWIGGQGSNGFRRASLGEYMVGGSIIASSWFSPHVHDVPATIRIERSGSNWTLKYYTAGTWYTSLSDINIGNGNITEITYYLSMYANSGDGTFTVDYDNFKVNYGIID